MQVLSTHLSFHCPKYSRILFTNKKIKDIFLFQEHVRILLPPTTTPHLFSLCCTATPLASIHPPVIIHSQNTKEVGLGLDLENLPLKKKSFSSNSFLVHLNQFFSHQSSDLSPFPCIQQLPLLLNKRKGNIYEKVEHQKSL